MGGSVTRPTGTVSRVSDDRERLVEQLSRIRDLSGLSLRALARQTGLSSSSLSRYLTGQLIPPWEAVVALCRAVGRDPRPLRALWVQASKAGAAPSARRNDLPADLTDFTGARRRPRWSQSCCALRMRSRSMGWPASARPALLSMWRIGSLRRFRTVGSISTCKASLRAMSRWTRRRRWVVCWRRWASRILRRTRPTVRHCGARS